MLYQCKSFQIVRKGCRTIIVLMIVVMMLVFIKHFELEKNVLVPRDKAPNEEEQLKEVSEQREKYISEIKQLKQELEQKEKDLSEVKQLKEVLEQREKDLSDLKQLNITLFEKDEELSKKNKDILDIQSKLDKLQVENQEKSLQLIEIQAKYAQNISLSQSDHVTLQKSLDDAALVNALKNKSNEVLNDSSLSNKTEVVEKVVEVGNQSFKDLNLLHPNNNVYKSSTNTVLNNTNEFVFNSYNSNKPPIFNLRDEIDLSFMDTDRGVMCFIPGTDLQKSHRKCKCKAEYFGADCGIPAAAWFSYFRDEGSIINLRRRAKPRRVIHGMQVNHELVMFETRLHELYNTVDVFIIVEANHTDYGDPKPLVFLDKLKNGYLREYQDKIVHVFVDSEPPDAKENSWRAHNYMRSFLGPQSISRINGIRDDDIFIISDADEIPTHEIVTFLKLYDGYYEHVCFRYRWNIYGFFWKSEHQAMTEVCSVSSIKMLRESFDNNTWMIRAQRHTMTWWAGTLNHYAGWHCSWCFSPEGIVRKLDSAQAADRPRWGDYPEKKNITYIQYLIDKGRWFDDKGRFVPAKVNEPMYAPSYLLKNADKYKTLLYHTRDRPKIS